MDLKLKDKTALVTGSTAGIGLEIARALAVEGAQLAVARGLAQATKGTGVTVNSILPGPTRSEGIVEFLKSVSSNPTGSPQAHEAEFFTQHRSASLLQRLIEPQEVASLVAYVASPLSAATNGASLKVEGGLVTTIA